MAPKGDNRSIAELNTAKECLFDQLNRFKDFVEGYNETQLNILKLKLERAEGWLNEFVVVYKGLKILLKDMDLQNLEQELIDFENSFDQLICKARDLLPVQRATSTPVAMDARLSTMNETHIEASIKLPSLGLPHFSGAYEDWTEFHDNFDGIINNNNSLSRAQKLHYLKNALQGEASKVVQSLKICDANYDIAMSLLKKRYEMKNLIVTSHLRAIFTLPNLIKEDSSKLRFMSDTVTKSIRGLNSLGVNTENWDALLIFIIVEKLDNVSCKEWQNLVDPNTLPTWNQFTEFLNKRCGVLEALYPTTSAEDVKKKPNKHFNMAATTTGCAICCNDHRVQECPTWSSLGLEARKDLIKKHKLCFRCLTAWHWKHRCRRDACSKCKGSHHVIIHQDKEQEGTTADGADIERSVVTTAVKSRNHLVLLSTACVFVQNELGERFRCRALLDNGAQSNFLRTEVCKKLNLKKRALNSTVCGISGAETAIRSQVDVTISSTCGKFALDINCLVIDKITDRIPLNSFSVEDIPIPKHVQLADPDFNVSNDIDILLGVDIFWKILGDRKMDLGPMVLRQTRLGWILAGAMVPSPSTGNKTMVNLALQECLVKFWQVEQCIESEALSREQRACEDHYVTNTSRDATGRFVVKIPLKAEPDALGESYHQAERRLLSLERRFRADSNYKVAYAEFISEYLKLGHMHKVDEPPGDRYFMPHHGVIKEGSTSTRLRTVFDSSAKTTSGYSYNDLQLVGPVVQNDLFAILVNFRKPKYAMTSDIEKMYRQILVHPQNRKFQSILWRWHESEDIQMYELSTVTYGTTSAPFLATRCIKQIALDVSESEPKVAHALSNCMYVDDFLGGGDTIEETNQLALRLRSILQEYGFPLRKWLSCDARVLEGIPADDCAKSCLQIGERDATKTLGLVWNHQSDNLMYQIESPDGLQVISKRGLLSCISKIFDPLGLLAPSIILAKIMLQRLWQEHIKWDDPLPEGLHLKWMEFVKYLPHLNKIRVPRRVIVGHAAAIDIHGFADASESAIGACIYFISEGECGVPIVRLVCAKSRVAPLRPETIPRLELCAAALLTRLVHKVKESLHLNIRKCVLWSDSTITLAWIKTEPYLLKQFVANRVAQIQNLNISNDWRHVPSGDNPADLLSRGVRPDKLEDSELWWHGPSWLRMEETDWPTQSISVDSKDMFEMRAARIVGTPVTKIEQNIFLNISGMERMLRAGALALRWFERWKSKSRIVGPFTPSELENVLKRLILAEQSKYFKAEVQDLQKKRMVAKRSCLFRLRPFVDPEGILRVGGRLKHAKMDYDSRHQIILPAGNELSRRIAEAEHERLLHCGQQQLLSSLRRKYWPIRGRNLVKGIISKCVSCFKADPKSVTPVFGVLPAERVLPSPPFFHTGADYSGPYLIRDKRGRGYKITKGYICVFVCLSTKAIHLELVSDLTTEGFIACLRRFIARRGKPKSISTDNATNFVGSNNELRELGNFLTEKNSKIHDVLLGEGIDWRFIPPRSPSFGGIWEAGVKSVKNHLKRVAGQALLVFEEFYTLLTQIEAILNSRPLTPLSSDPLDLNPLTPGHFLVGRPLTSLIDENLSDVATNRLSRFQLVQQIVQNYWTRWSKEYLHELQQVRGDRTSPNIEVGTLVILREDNLPPCKWKTARVTEVFPGVDGVIRVIKVKTSAGEFKRAVRNVCVLPI